MKSLTEELSLGREDLITGAIPTRSKAPDLQTCGLRSADLAFTCSAKHSLAQIEGSVPLDKIHKYPCVSFEPDSDLIRKLTVYLYDNGARPPQYTVETSSIFGPVELLKSGDHILFGSPLLVEYPIGHGLVRPTLESKIDEFEMWLIFRDGQGNQPAYRGVMNVV